MRFNPFRRKLRARRGRTMAPAVTESWLKPETKQAIFGVVLILLSIIAVFSFFDQAGRVGEAMLAGLRRMLGWLAYVAPFFTVYIGYLLLKPGEQMATWRKVGMGLMAVGLIGVFHIVGVPVEDALETAYQGKGGGFLGFTLSYPISLALSPLVAAVIFVSVTAIGFLMTFNLSPADVARTIRSLRPAVAPEDGDAEEVAEGGEEAPAPAKPFFSIRSVARAVAPDTEQMKLDDKQAEKEKQQQDARRKQLKAANRKYNPPPLELLASSVRQPKGGDVEANKRMIATTLEQFNISVEMGKAKVGPTVTQYTFKPDEGVRLSQITALQNDLARALKAHPVRIEAPIPNTDLVGIEIPNKEVALVRLRDLLAAKEFRLAESPLAFALGKDVAGEVVVGEIDRMPHALIAGATNSGKSVCIHSMLMSLLYRNSPALLRLILVDPKRVELTAYNGIPHLWGTPVIVDTHKTLNVLKWCLREMDRRYKLLEGSGSRNLLSYNIGNPDDALPFIVLVIDELADLMAKHAREVEGPVVRLSQLARAVGIHLILATQRPSVNVITGLIKANVPTRIGFKVASQVDSRTILDMSGSEKLLGTGDMLFLATDNTKPRRLQGGYVSEEEVRAVVDYITEHNEPVEFEETEDVTREETGGGSTNGEEADDPLFEEAKRIAVDSGKVSASLLQRRLRVGYARGARLVDMLEDQGVVGRAEGNKPREVIAAGHESGYQPEEASLPAAEGADKEEEETW